MLEQLVNLIAAKPGLSAKEYAEVLMAHPSTIRKHIQTLVTHGIVYAVPTNQTNTWFLG